MPEPKDDIKKKDELLNEGTSEDYSSIFENYNPSPQSGEDRFDQYVPSEINLDEGLLADPNLDVNEERALRQSTGVQAYKGVGRAIIKAGSEVAKMPGEIAGLANWAQTGFDSAEIDKLVDNAWIQSINEWEEKTNDESLTIYKSKVTENGGLAANIQDPAFWATEGADGVGFLVSMFAPGAAMKGLKIGRTVGKTMLKAGINPLTAKAIAGGSEMLAPAAVNAFFESTVESGETYKGAYEKLMRDSDGTPEYEADARLKAGEAAVGTFKANMSILMIPNMIDQKLLFGSFSKARRLTTSVGKRIAGAGAKTVGTAAKEGFGEEGLQFAADTYFQNKALGKDDRDAIEGIIGTYAENTGNVDFQKSVFLGSLLGGGMTAIHEGKRVVADHKRDKGLSSLLDNNMASNYRTESDMYLLDEEGNVVMDEEGKPEFDSNKVMEFAAQVQSNERDMELLGEAVEEGNKETYDFLKNMQDFKFMMPYFQQDGGMELLNTHIDKIAEAEKARLEGIGQTDMSVDEIKADLLNKAENFQNIYDTIDAQQEYSTTLPIDTAEGRAFSNKVRDNKIAETVYQDYFKDRIDAITNELSSKGVLATDEKTSAELISEAVKGRKILPSEGDVLLDKSVQLEQYNKDFDSSVERYNKLNDTKHIEKEFKKDKEIRAERQAAFEAAQEKAEINNIPDGTELVNDETGETSTVDQSSDKTILNNEDGSTTEIESKEELDGFSAVPEGLPDELTDGNQDMIPNLSTEEAPNVDAENIISDSISSERETYDDNEFNSNNKEVELALKARSKGARVIKDAIRKTKQKELLTANDIVQIQATIDYMNALIDDVSNNTSPSIDEIVNNINELNKILNSKGKKRSKFGKNIEALKDSLKDDITNEFRLLNDLTDRVSELKLELKLLTELHSDLSLQSEYYMGMLKDPSFEEFSESEINNKIDTINKKKTKLKALIDKLRQLVGKTVSYLNEYIKYAIKRSNRFSRFKKISEFRELSSEEIKNAIADGTIDNYASTKNRFEKLEQSLIDSLDDVEFLEREKDKEDKRIDQLEAKLVKYNRQIRFLEDVISDITEKMPKDDVPTESSSELYNGIESIQVDSQNIEPSIESSSQNIIQPSIAPPEISPEEAAQIEDAIEVLDETDKTDENIVAEGQESLIESSDSVEEAEEINKELDNRQVEVDTIDSVEVADSTKAQEKSTSSKKPIENVANSLASKSHIDNLDGSKTEIPNTSDNSRRYSRFMQNNSMGEGKFTAKIDNDKVVFNDDIVTAELPVIVGKYVDGVFTPVDENGEPISFDQVDELGMVSYMPIATIDHLDSKHGEKYYAPEGMTEDQARELAEQLNKEYITRRKNILNEVNNGRDVYLTIAGKSRGIQIPNVEDGKVTRKSVSEGISNNFEIVISVDGVVTFSDKSEMSVAKGLTYIVDNDTGETYFADSRQLNDSEVNTIVGLLRKLADNHSFNNSGLPQLTTTKIQVGNIESDIESELKKIIYYTGSNKKDDTQMYVAGNIINANVASQFYMPNKKVANVRGKAIVFKGDVYALLDQRALDNGDIEINPELVSALEGKLPKMRHQVSNKHLNADLTSGDEFVMIDEISSEGEISSKQFDSYSQYLYEEVLEASIIPADSKTKTLTEDGTIVEEETIRRKSQYLLFDNNYTSEGRVAQSEDITPNDSVPTDDIVDPFGDVEANPDGLDNINMFRNALDTKPVSKVNKQKAQEYINSLFSGVEVSVVEGLIQNKAWGMFNKAGITLSDVAESDTIYHEAFHVATQLYLTDEQRYKLYNEWVADNRGKEFKTYKGKTKLAEEFTSKDIEELLAEDFRQYVINKNTDAAYKESFFRKLLNFIKKVLNITPSNANDLFQYIDSGFFKNKKQINATNSTYYSTIPGETEQFTQKVLDSVNYQFFRFLYREKNFDISSFKSADMGEIYNSIIEEFNKLRGGYKAKYEDPNTSQEAKTQIEYINSNIVKIINSLQNPQEENSIAKLHAEYLKKIGIEIFDNEIDEILNNEDKGNDSAGNYWATKSLSMSARDTASFEVKALLSAIPNATYSNGKMIPIYNEIGLVEAIDFNTISSLLFNKLSKSTSIEDMDNLMIEMSKEHPSVSMVRHYFGFGRELTTSQQHSLKNKFWNTFYKQENNYVLDQIGEDGKVSTFDATIHSFKKKIKAAWSNVSNKGLTYNEDGMRVYSKKFIDSLINPDNIENAFKFLKQLGITMTNTPEGKHNNKIKTDANAIYNKILSKATTNLYLKKQSDNEQQLNSFLSLEADTTMDALENSHVNVSGEKQYNITLHNYMSSFINELNKYNTRAELLTANPHLSDSYLTNSLMLKPGGVLFDTKGNKKNNKNTNVELIIKEGMRLESDKWIDYESASTNDKAYFYLNSLDKNIYPMYRASDNKIFRGFRLPSLYDGNKVNGIGQMVDYLADELYKYSETKNRKTGDMYQYENLENGVLIDMVKSTKNDKVKAAINALLGKKEITPADIDVFIKNYRKLKTTKGEFIGIEQVFSDYIDYQTKENTDFLIENKAATKYDNNGKSFIKYNGQTYNEADFSKKMESIGFNNLFGNIEQLKMFFGSPVYYKSTDNFFKRMSGSTGTKEIPNTSKEYNQFANKTLERLDNRLYEDENPTISTMTFRDKYVPSRYLKEYMDEFKDDEKKSAAIENYYGNMNEGDGQGYITLDEYRNIADRLGIWDEKQEKLYNWEKEYYNANKDNNTEKLDELTKTKPEGLFNPLKPQYFGPLAESYFIPAFYKLSLAPIIPSVVSDKQMHKLHTYMVDNKIGIATFISGNKLGSKVEEGGQPQDVFNDDLTVKDIENALEQKTYTKNWGIQLNTGRKMKDKSPSGTQEAKQTISNTIVDGKYVPMSFIEPDGTMSEATPENTENKVNTYNALNAAKISLASGKLVKKLGIEFTDDGYKLVDGNTNKFIQSLRDEFIKRDMTEDEIKSLYYIGANGIDVLPSRQSVENILYALSDRQVIRKPRYGTMAIQVSVSMMEGVNKAYDVVTIGDKKFRSNDLKTYHRIDNKGNDQISRAEIYLPSFYSKYIKKGQITDPRLLRLIGFRIPTQGLNSMESMVIKDFLPPEAGNIIIMPSEVVAKAGSDFDIDKLSIYYPNSYVNKDGEPVYIEESKYDDYVEDQSIRLFNSQFARELKEISPELHRDLSKVFRKIEDGTIDSYVKKVRAALTKYSADSTNEDNILEIQDATETLEFLIEDFNDEGIKLMSEEDFRAAAIDNQLLEIKDQFITSPENFKSLITPIAADTLEESAKMIRELKGTKADSKQWYSITEFKTAINKAVQLLGSKAGVGIAATQSTSHVLFQQAGISLAENIKVKKGKDTVSVPTNINFEHNVRNGKVDLSGNETKAGENIGELLNEMITSFVDAATNPFIFELLNNINTANTFMYLIRSGVPVNTISLLMNQPIVEEYLNEVSRTKGISYDLSKLDTDEDVNRMTIQDDLIKKYGKDMTVDQVYTEAELKSMVKNGSKLNPNQNKAQVQLLKDFLRYEDSADVVRKLVQSVSYDTKPPKNSSDLLMKNQTLKDVVNSGVFDMDSLSKLLEDGSFIEPFTDFVGDLEEMYTPFVLALKNPAMKTMMQYFISMYNSQSIVMKYDDKIKLLETVRSELINYAIQQSPEINAKKRSLLIGSNSVANRVLKAQNNPKYKDNYFIHNLQPVIRGGKDFDNVILNIDSLDNLTRKMINDGWQELFNSDTPDNTLGMDLMYQSILQAGILVNPMSFIKFAPSEQYSKLVNDSLSNFKASRYGDFITKFYSNNTKVDTIVPKKKNEALPFYKKFTLVDKNDKSKGYEMTIEKNKDWSFGDISGKNFQILGVRDFMNNKTLVEYTNSSIVESNNVDFRMTVEPAIDLANAADNANNENVQPSQEDINNTKTPKC